MNNREMVFWLRKRNEGDYLMAGELFVGGYEAPDFRPVNIIDGGANIGLFALWATALFPEANLICYEPDVENAELLGANLDSNDVKAKLCCAALFPGRTAVYYHASESHLGYVTDEPSGIEVACKMPDVGPDCWLKLDIEGAEYEVIPALFEQQYYPRFLSMEVHHFNTKGPALLEFLHEHGYTVKGGDDDDAVCCTISARRRND